MTPVERTRIINDDYLDFIIDYRNNRAILDTFEDAVVNIINEYYAVVHVPFNTELKNLLNNYSYSFIPKIYGLTSRISVESSGVTDLTNLPGFDLTGNGVLIGIIDTGIDYLNPIFIKENGQTKILSIWDQTIQSESTYPIITNYGTEYTSEMINAALISNEPLNIVPSIDTNGHGTMMAGVAVGNENQEINFRGVAPDAELVVVRLKQAKRYIRELFLIQEDVIAFQENDIMWGVYYCIQMARRLDRPIVICLGLGTSQTSHAGQSNLGNYLSIVADYTNVCVVVAVGNEGNSGRHFFSRISTQTGSTSVELNVGENDKNFCMELWGDFPGLFSVDIQSPGGEYISRIVSGIRLSREINFLFDITIINLQFQISETLTGDQLIFFRFQNATSGIWKFNVYSQGDLEAGFNIWLPMGEFISNNTFFIQPVIYTTVLSPSTAYVPLSITAYNPYNRNLYPNSSRGYTSDDVVKPELAAPGVNYIAPSLNNLFINYTGTGVAAAHAAGVAALFMEWAVFKQNIEGVDTIVIKSYLIRGAIRRQNLVYPNRDWGYGVINIYNVFEELRT